VLAGVRVFFLRAPDLRDADLGPFHRGRPVARVTVPSVTVSSFCTSLSGVSFEAGAARAWCSRALTAPTEMPSSAAGSRPGGRRPALSPVTSGRSCLSHRRATLRVIPQSQAPNRSGERRVIEGRGASRAR
jgi:hypothetical protein